MMKTESENLEYIGGVFMGLSGEKQDYLLDTARSLLEVQYGENCPADNEAVSHSQRENFTFLESSSAYTGEKI